MVASGGLFLASFVPVLQEVAIPLRVIGAGLGGSMAATEIPDLLLLDKAAQAGRGGKMLTSQSPEQAKLNAVMAFANVGLAALDVGAEVGAIQKLGRISMVIAQSGVQVSRATWAEVIRLARQGPAGVEKARAMLDEVKGMSQVQMVDDRMRLMEESNGLKTALDPLYDKPAVTKFLCHQN